MVIVCKIVPNLSFLQTIKGQNKVGVCKLSFCRSKMILISIQVFSTELNKNDYNFMPIKLDVQEVDLNQAKWH